MSYVFDNGPLSMLFKNYFRSVFSTLWENFDDLIASGEIVSVREVAREIADSSIEVLRTWVADNGSVFAVPSPEEAAFITQIYSVKHFQHNIEQQKLLKGGRMADPFVIAKARIECRTVVTTEIFKPNGTKIPNICRHFGIECMSIQEFMEAQNWRF